MSGGEVVPFPFPPPQGEGGTPTGDAAVADVLAPKTFESATAGLKATGTMPNQGAPAYTPTGNTQTGPAGYYTGLTVDGVGASRYQTAITSASSVSSFNNYTGGTLSKYALNIGSISGATKILAIMAWSGSSGLLTLVNVSGGFGPWVGDAEGSTDIAYTQDGNVYTVGGAMSLTPSSVIIPATAASATYRVLVIYI